LNFFLDVRENFSNAKSDRAEETPCAMIRPRLSRDRYFHGLVILFGARAITKRRIRVTDSAERRRVELDGNPTLAVFDRLLWISLDSLEVRHASSSR
jgi:hypothetical protein